MEFSEKIIQEVWEKGIITTDFDPDEYRKDEAGFWIIRSDYGNSKSGFGWDIERIDPNGGYEIDNLKPVSWSKKNKQY